MRPLAEGDPDAEMQIAKLLACALVFIERSGCTLNREHEPSHATRGIWRSLRSMYGGRTTSGMTPPDSMTTPMSVSAGEYRPVLYRAADALDPIEDAIDPG